MKLLYIDPNLEGLNNLVDTNVELYKIPSGSDTLRKCNNSEMPYIYAVKTKFSEINLKLVMDIVKVQPDCN